MRFRATSAVVTAVLGCAFAATPVQAADSIAAFVAQSGGEFDRNPFDYDILLTAAETAGLVDALADPDAELTLFAPNDYAFIRLARDLGFEGFGEEAAWDFLVEALTGLGDGDPIPVLTDVLSYHVAPDSVSLIDVLIQSFLGNTLPTLLEGATIKPFFVVLIDNEPDLDNPFVFLPINVKTGNGIVHTITRVLIPLDLP